MGGPKSLKALRDGEPRGLIPILLFKYGNETEKIKTYISYFTNIRVPWAKKKLFCVIHPLLPPMKTFAFGRKSFHSREEGSGENYKLDP